MDNRKLPGERHVAFKKKRGRGPKKWRGSGLKMEHHDTSREIDDFSPLGQLILVESKISPFSGAVSQNF